MKKNGYELEKFKVNENTLNISFSVNFDDIENLEEDFFKSLDRVERDSILALLFFLDLARVIGGNNI